MRAYCRPVKVLVVDDSEWARCLYEAVLPRWGYEVARMEASPRGACAYLLEAKPDVVILDLNLAGGHGFEALDWMGLRRPPVVIHSGNDCLYALYEAGRRGVESYIARDQDKGMRSLRRALELAPRGQGIYICEPHRLEQLQLLTWKQMDALACLAVDMSVAVACDRMDGISPVTYRKHLMAAREKLGLADVAALRLWARSAGLRFRLTGAVLMGWRA